jgi:hypothetical protein
LPQYSHFLPAFRGLADWDFADHHVHGVLFGRDHGDNRRGAERSMEMHRALG